MLVHLLFCMLPSKTNIHVHIYMQLCEGSHNKHCEYDEEYDEESKIQSLLLFKNSGCQKGFKRPCMLCNHEDESGRYINSKKQYMNVMTLTQEKVLSLSKGRTN